MGGQYFDQPTIATYTHTQAAAANVWIVTHNLNSISLQVEIWIDGFLVHTDVNMIDPNAVSISFNIPAAGIVSITAAS